MIRIYGKFLSKEQRKFLRAGIIYTLSYLVPDDIYLENCEVNVKISATTAEGDETETHGTCEFSVNDDGQKICDVWIFKGLINDEGEDIWAQLNELLYYLFHELVHCKQYLCGELTDISDKEYIFHGVKRKVPVDGDEEGYYNQPHEIEAYGRQQGLVARYHRKWKEENDDRRKRA
jgi:hypothetical protein